jgi:hypothetical protein
VPRKFQTLEAWVDEALHDDDKTGEGGAVRACTAFTLMHVNVSGIGTDEVHAFPLAGKTHTAASLARRIQAKAEGRAQNLGKGSQQFLVHAFYGQAQPEATHPIRTLDGELVAGDDYGYATEAPNEKGILSQLMRHLEHKDEMVMQFWKATVADAVKERRELQAEVNESYKIVREVMMNLDAERHRQQMAQSEYQRTTLERGRLMDMVPAIANGLTGRDIFPQASADTAFLDAIARKLTPDEVEGLVTMGKIPKEMAPAMIARIMQVHEKDAAQRSELARIPPANRADGEKDVQGN